MQFLLSAALILIVTVAVTVLLVLNKEKSLKKARILQIIIRCTVFSGGVTLFAGFGGLREPLIVFSLGACIFLFILIFTGFGQ